MKNLILFFLILGLSSCKGDKLVIKKITNNDITIKWYFYSYISDFSPEYIEVEKDGDILKLYEAKHTISDVSIKDNEILIKLYNPSNGIIYTKKVPSQVFDYKIVIDTTATYEEFRKVPEAIKE